MDIGGYGQMAQAGTQMAGGLTSGLGGLISGIWGKKTAKPVYFSPEVNYALGQLAAQLPGQTAGITSAVNDYSLANKERIADTARLGAAAENDYNALLGRALAIDPTATYERIRAGNLKALNDVSGLMTDQGRRYDSLAAAAMGRGGRPDGSYERVLRADRVGRAMAPQFGSIMANLGRDTGILSDATMNPLNYASNVVGARTNLASLGEGMQLNPMLAQLAMTGQLYGNLGSLADTARVNSAGFNIVGNRAANIGDALQSAGNTMAGAGGAAGNMGLAQMAMQNGGGYSGGWGGGYGGYGTPGMYSAGFQYPYMQQQYSQPYLNPQSWGYYGYRTPAEKAAFNAAQAYYG